MSLDELKNDWENIEGPSQEETISNQQSIEKMMDNKIPQSAIKLALPQVPLILLYAYLLISYIAFVRDFNGLGYKGLFVLGILLSFVIPVLSVRSIYQFYNEGTLSDSYNEGLKLVEEQCRRLNKVHYILLVLNILLLFVSVILMPKIYSEYLSSQTTVTAFVIGALILSFFSFRIYKFYKGQIMRNETFLKELQQD